MVITFTPQEKSPFNVITPPNKTVIDAMHGTFSDMTQVQSTRYTMFDSMIVRQLICSTARLFDSLLV